MTILFAVLASTLAASPRDDVPAVIRDAVSMELNDGEITTAIPPRMIRRVDVNGDGRPDWHVDFEVAGEVTWCGTGGCRHQLYVATASGAPLLAFDEIARSLAVRDRRVIADIYGSYCGSYGADSCQRIFSWNFAEERLSPLESPDEDPILFGPLFQPVVVGRDAWPETVARAVATREATCAAAGATLDEAASAIVRSPDLDGDGASDWIIGSPWSLCLPPDSMPADAVAELPRPTLVVLAGETATPIFEGSSGDYAVDISTRPATLMLVENEEARIAHCPGRPTHCPVTRLRWEVALRRLVPMTQRDAPRSRASPQTDRRPGR